jgi:ribonucleoside-diphosphate reductase alpha chain
MQTEPQSQSSASTSAQTGKTQNSSASSATAPGQIRVIKRNGAVVGYDESKVVVAITKAYLAVEGGTAAASSRVHDTVVKLGKQISVIFRRRMPSGGTIHIEDIQDQVELALMRTGEHKVARSYVLYRAERARLRDQQRVREHEEIPAITVTYADGTQGPLDTARLRTVIDEACEGLESVSADAIYTETIKNLYPGVRIADVRTSSVMTARTMVEKDPNYSYVTARLLLDTLRSEALSFLGIADSATQGEMHYRYPAALRTYIEKGAELGLLSPHLLDYDLELLGEALKAERDAQFTYLGLQTLYDRYFIHSEGVRFELPQVFFMRVAMGLASNEENREERAIEFYNLISSFDYMTSTPQLFNSGTLRPQLSSSRQ